MLIGAFYASAKSGLLKGSIGKTYPPKEIERAEYAKMKVVDMNGPDEESDESEDDDSETTKAPDFDPKKPLNQEKLDTSGYKTTYPKTKR